MKRVLKTILVFFLCLAIAVPATPVEAGSSAKSKAQYPVKQFYKYAKTLNLSKMFKYVASQKSDSDSVSKSNLKNPD